MKLKNVLLSTFLTLTIIPIAIISLLLYKSGFELSKESYTRNLIESITVQVDYISQTIENSMVSDVRFANKMHQLSLQEDSDSPEKGTDLLELFQSYLETSEDKISVCILLDRNNTPLYTIGEEKLINNILAQSADLSVSEEQTIHEFKLTDNTYSLGIVTPIQAGDGTYGGSLISVYDKSYVFKIISSYYTISDSFTYLCRENGDIVNFNTSAETEKNILLEQSLHTLNFQNKGTITTQIDHVSMSGFYAQIADSPWYLVGFISDKLVYSFTNQFILAYILIIILVLVIDIILALYFSRKVVKPIRGLIRIMEEYENNFDGNELHCDEKSGYFETRYLFKKFTSMMKTIILVQHNFKGIYQLYQSNDMDDTNIDIDVKKQLISSNKTVFQDLFNSLDIPKENCVVDRFICCFCESDQVRLRTMFEKMRDEHLSVTCEADIYTPFLNQKWFHTLVVPMYEDDRLSRLFIQLRDISNFKKNEFDSMEQARKDTLTGLYNRLGFLECVNKRLSSEPNTHLHALLFMDMNFFKLVNDNYGHSAGDELLRRVATTIQSTIGSADISCRFGGDEFAVFLPHTTVEHVNQLKQTLTQRIVYPYQSDKTSFVVSISIGSITWTNDSAQTLEDFLQQADTAMYQAKREFKEHIAL